MFLFKNIINDLEDCSELLYRLTSTFLLQLVLCSHNHHTAFAYHSIVPRLLQMDFITVKSGFVGKFDPGRLSYIITF